MATVMSSATSVAFRHVIEDGLSILSAKQLEPVRRKYVLEDLASLMKEADRGFELAKRNHLLVSSGDRSAYESFSFLDRYLSNRYDDQLRNALQKAQAAFDQLCKNHQVPQETQDVTVRLLEELLSSIKREGSTGIPSELSSTHPPLKTSGGLAMQQTLRKSHPSTPRPSALSVDLAFSHGMLAAMRAKAKMELTDSDRTWAGKLKETFSKELTSLKAASELSEMKRTGTDNQKKVLAALPLPSTNLRYEDAPLEKLVDMLKSLEQNTLSEEQASELLQSLLDLRKHEDRS